MSSSLDFSFDRIRTPLNVGCSILILFTGIGLTQAFWYYRNFKNDPLTLKVLIGFTTTLVVVCTAIAMYIQHLLVNPQTNFGGVGSNLYGALLILGGTVINNIQAYFIWRLHRLLHTPLVSYILWLLTFCCYIVTIVSVAAAHFNSFSRAFDLSTRLIWLPPIALFFDAVIDISVSSILVYFFRARSRDSGFSGARFYKMKDFVAKRSSGRKLGMSF